MHYLLIALVSYRMRIVSPLFRICIEVLVQSDKSIIGPVRYVRHVACVHALPRERYGFV
jgi:hypothetical protein